MTISLDPLQKSDINLVWKESAGKLFRAAYLQSFSPDRVQDGRIKYNRFDEWWDTLNDEQQMRVKGALAGETL